MHSGKKCLGQGTGLRYFHGEKGDAGTSLSNLCDTVLDSWANRWCFSRDFRALEPSSQWRLGSQVALTLWIPLELTFGKIFFLKNHLDPWGIVWVHPPTKDSSHPPIPSSTTVMIVGVVLLKPEVFGPGAISSFPFTRFVRSKCEIVNCIVFGPLTSKKINRRVSGFFRCSIEPQKKKRPYFPWNTGCLIGIIIMVC